MDKQFLLQEHLIPTLKNLLVLLEQAQPLPARVNVSLQKKVKQLQ